VEGNRVACQSRLSSYIILGPLDIPRFSADSMTTAAAPQLRERSAFEIIDVAIQLFRRHYATFVMLMMLAAFPYWIVLWMSGLMTMMANPLALGARMAFNPSVSLLLPLTWVWMFVFRGAIIVAASDAYLNGVIEPGRAVSTTLSKALPLIGASVLLALGCAVVALPTLFIGVVYLLLRYFAILPAILLENQSVTNAFHRSRDLSFGFKWRILGTMFLSWVIMFVVILLFQALLAFTSLPPLAGQLVSAAASVFIGPLITLTLTVLYYDQRVRKDGFDLEVATRDLVPAPAH